MFISEDEYLIEGTDLGYISAKRVGGVWGISLPPKSESNPRFADIATRLTPILEALTANTIPVVIVPVRGTLQNMASGSLPSARRARLLASIGGAE